MRELKNTLTWLFEAITKQTSTASESKPTYATTQHIGYDRFEYRAHKEMMAAAKTRSELKVLSETTDI